MREIKPITPSADEKKCYQDMVEPIIRKRYLKLLETKEQTGLINQEYWMRVVQAWPFGKVANAVAGVVTSVVGGVTGVANGIANGIKSLFLSLIHTDFGIIF